MKFELDHLFILVDVGAIEADRLVELGLIEASSNVHPGQGTTNRRFFFHNAMLEFLWVHDVVEVRSESIRKTRLWERWRDRDQSCPFGICLRPEEAGTIAFPHWNYQPPYLPPNLSITVATNHEILTEPFLFQTPFGKRPDQAAPERAQPLEHPLALREMTSVEIVTPVTTTISEEFQAVLNTQQIILRSGESHWIELGFDGEQQGQQMDFRSHLPLVLKW